MSIRDVFPQRKCKVLCVIPDDGKREYGNTVYLEDDLKNRFLFAHLDWFAVKVNDIIEPGGVFAEIGATGYCPSGAHLHWGMFPPGGSFGELRASNVIDPTKYLREYGAPCRTIVTNCFGSKKCNPKLKGHEGIDFSSWRTE